MHLHLTKQVTTLQGGCREVKASLRGLPTTTITGTPRWPTARFLLDTGLCIGVAVSQYNWCAGPSILRFSSEQGNALRSLFGGRS
jgi:hypothetical protein